MPRLPVAGGMSCSRVGRGYVRQCSTWSTAAAPIHLEEGCDMTLIRPVNIDELRRTRVLLDGAVRYVTLSAPSIAILP
jgi:hypothetical protein